MHRYKYLNLSTVGQQRYQRNSVAMQWCCHWGDPCFSSTTERSCSRPVHGTDITWPKNRRHLMLLKRTFNLFLSRLFNYPLLQLLNNFPWTCMWSASCLSKNKVSWQKKTSPDYCYPIFQKSQTMLHKGFTHNIQLRKHHNQSSQSEKECGWPFSTKDAHALIDCHSDGYVPNRCKVFINTTYPASVVDNREISFWTELRDLELLMFGVLFDDLVHIWFVCSFWEPALFI